MQPVQQPASSPPRSDLVTWALILFTAIGVGMAFVLTQQHEPIPGYLDAIIVGGLTSIGFYKAANPQQQQQVQQLGQQVQQLGTTVDLNHLDTMNTLADVAAPASGMPADPAAPPPAWLAPGIPDIGAKFTPPGAGTGALFRRLADGTFTPAGATLDDGELDDLEPAAVATADMGGSHNVPATPAPTEADLSALDADLATLPPTPIPSPGQTIEV
jgi:hypothetical protein